LQLFENVLSIPLHWFFCIKIIYDAKISWITISYKTLHCYGTGHRITAWRSHCWDQIGGNGEGGFSKLLCRLSLIHRALMLTAIFSGKKVKLPVLRFDYKPGKCHHLGPRTPLYSPLGANRNFSILCLLFIAINFAFR
jgi:hypothetical protein